MIRCQMLIFKGDEKKTILMPHDRTNRGMTTLPTVVTRSVAFTKKGWLTQTESWRLKPQRTDSTRWPTPSTSSIPPSGPSHLVRRWSKFWRKWRKWRIPSLIRAWWYSSIPRLEESVGENRKWRFSSSLVSFLMRQSFFTHFQWSLIRMRLTCSRNPLRERWSDSGSRWMKQQMTMAVCISLKDPIRRKCTKGECLSFQYGIRDWTGCTCWESGALVLLHFEIWINLGTFAIRTRVQRLCSFILGSLCHRLKRRIGLQLHASQVGFICQILGQLQRSVKNEKEMPNPSFLPQCSVNSW